MSENNSAVLEPCPDLLKNLRKFRFTKKPLVEEKAAVTNSPKEPPPDNVSPATPNTLKTNGVVPASSAPETPESPVKNVKKRKVFLLSSDSEDDGTAGSGKSGDKNEEKSKPEVDEYGRTSQENALKFLMSAFPGKDVLLIQDALNQNDWDVEKATEKLSKIFDKDTPNSAPPNKKKRLGDCNGVSKGAKKKKRMEVDAYDEDDDTEEEDNDQGFRKSKVFDSDADSDEEIVDDLVGDKMAVYTFLSKAEVSELQQIHQCSKKKAELICESRPFDGWKDMVEKLQSKSGLGGELLNYTQDLLQTRNVVAALIKKCVKLADKMESAVAAGSSSIRTQPSIMSKQLKLSDYQLVGLNWLLIMHAHQVNGILADEMGLGKTVQIISFLAHLKENKQNLPGKPHLIVVPSSTLENWRNELGRWCPSLNVITYYGSQDDRKYQRIDWAKNGFGDTDVLLTTYSMVTSCPEERKMFRVVPLHYAIFDEAHMLKNMSTQRYENLVKINAPNRVLVTGTPLQNNLLELMSLLVFVMPKMFKGKQDCLKALFAKGAKQQGKTDNEDALPDFERTQINQAKRIMKPFVLRRLKRDVLQGLPKKTDEVLCCNMIDDQEKKYKQLIATFSRQARKELHDDEQAEPSESGIAMYMKLRRLANHPLLLRYHFTDSILKDMAKRLQGDPMYKDTVFDYIFDDLCVMSDFELHKMACEFKSCYGLRLKPEHFGRSGKLEEMNRVLPKLQKEGHRVLVFSQFVIVLDILEEYFKIVGYKCLRLDGSTPVTQRQEMIDEFNEDPSIFIFMLSTRAGGLGINLTTADTVIIHDVDPNPHNDKQAEDRCHRIGQTKPVTVFRLVSKNTIEENILALAQEKLELEREVSSTEENDQSEKKSVARLLKQALGLDKKSTKSPSCAKSPTKRLS